MFAELFDSGRIIDLIILLVVFEVAAMLALYYLTGLGPRPQNILPTLLSGLLLMLTLRAAIANLSWPFLALPLALALAAHLLDLAQRWRAR